MNRYLMLLKLVIPIALVSCAIEYLIGSSRFLQLDAAYLIKPDHNSPMYAYIFRASYVIRLQLIPATLALLLAAFAIYKYKIHIRLGPFALFCLLIGLLHYPIWLGMSSPSWFGTGYGYIEKSVLYMVTGVLIWFFCLRKIHQLSVASNA